MNSNLLRAQKQYESFIAEYFSAETARQSLNRLTDDFKLGNIDTNSALLDKAALINGDTPPLQNNNLHIRIYSCRGLLSHDGESVTLHAELHTQDDSFPLLARKLYIRHIVKLRRVANTYKIFELRIDPPFLDNTRETPQMNSPREDITDIAKANIELTALASSIPGGVFEVALDEDYTLLYASENFYKLYGYTKEELLRQHENKQLRLIHPDDIATVRGNVEAALLKQQSDLKFEHRILRGDGSIAWILVRGKIIANRCVFNGILIDITSRRKIEEELVASEKRLRMALDKNSIFVFDYNFASKRLVLPEDIAVLYDLPVLISDAPESIIESGMICPESQNDFLHMFRVVSEEKAASASCFAKSVTRFSVSIWNKITLTRAYDGSQQPVRGIGIIEDITKEKELELACFQEERYRDALLSDTSLYIEINLTQNTYNKRKGSWDFELDDAAKINYSAILSEVVKRSIGDEYQSTYLEMFQRDNALKMFGEGTGECKIEYCRKMKDGKISWMETTMTLVRDLVTGDVKGFMYIRDIDERKQSELHLAYASHHDALTGAFNKKSTENEVNRLLAENPGASSALLLLDIDRFKDINDTYGHYIGDLVLSRTVKVLIEIFKPCDPVGRLGGDEFAVFIRDASDRARAIHLGKTVCETFSRPLTLADHTLRISCSIGISFARTDGETFEELYRHSDLALYKAKRLGRNTCVKYCPKLSK